MLLIIKESANTNFAQFFLSDIKSDVPVQLLSKSVHLSKNKNKNKKQLQKQVRKFLLLPGPTVSKLL